MDGSGYPREISGSAISLGARIFAACDTLDALTVDRPYRKAIAFAEAVDFRRSASGSLYDPDVVTQVMAARAELLEFVGRILI